MAKRNSKNQPKPPVVNVSTTTNVNAWDSAAFSKLLSEQARANETAIKSLESSMASAGANQQQLAEQIAQTSMMKDIKEALIAQLQDKQFNEAKQEAIKLKEQEKLKIKEANTALKENLQLRDQESKAIANLANSMQTFKTMGDRMSDMSKKLKDNFGSMSALKTTALKAFNIGGIFNKSIAKEKFIKQQRDLGATGDRKTLASNFEGAYRTSKDIKKNEEEISRFKQDNDLSDEQLAKTQKGKALLAKREQGAEEYKKYDVKAGLVKPAGLENVSPTQQYANSGEAEETQIETVKQIEIQSDLLQKIADNTAGEGKEQKQKEASGEGGGGIMSGIGAGLKSLGGGLAGLGKGIGSGIQGLLTGIARGVMAFGNPKVLLGAAAMTLLGGAVFVMGNALQQFEDLDWETIGKGMVAVAGFGAIGALLGVVAAPLALGSAALGLLGGALWVIGKAMTAIGEGFEAMTSGLERLAALDGDNLLSVAAGVGALGLAMAAFGAGQAVAGIGQLVGNLLTIGSDSPVEQLLKIGDRGEGIQKAADGMEKLGTAMGAFSKIDKKSMEAINDFPWLRATAFVAAGGSMQVDGASVTQASKQNADAAAANSGSGGGNTAVVNAPVTTNNNTSQIIKSPIRNQESSMARFIGSRFSRA
jgi:hypothetical protein